LWRAGHGSTARMTKPNVNAAQIWRAMARPFRSIRWSRVCGDSFGGGSGKSCSAFSGGMTDRFLCVPIRSSRTRRVARRSPGESSHASAALGSIRACEMVRPPVCIDQPAETAPHPSRNCPTGADRLNPSANHLNQAFKRHETFPRSTLPRPGGPSPRLPLTRWQAALALGG
jgi:hypothetical protein